MYFKLRDANVAKLYTVFEKQNLSIFRTDRCRW